MTKEYKNEGIIQKGGRIEADQIAVGRNARAIRYVSEASEALDRAGLQEITARLAHLAQVLELHAGSLENREEVISSTETVTKELSEQNPNKLTLTSLLDGIARNVTSVTVIAKAVEALKTAIATLL